MAAPTDSDRIARVAVLGAGNGGCAAVVHLLHEGYDVRLYTRSMATLDPIRQRGGIEYIGALGDGLARPGLITGAIDEAIDGADLIMICVPSCAHEYYARLLGPILPNGSLVLLNPGHTGGSLHFAQILRQHDADRDVILGETATLTYGCRLVAPARVWLYKLKRGIPFAAFPGKRAQTAAELLDKIYAGIVLSSNVLETGLMNFNAMMHPAGMLLNTGWVEHSRGSFRFYSEGITPSIAHMIQRLDHERIEVIRGLNVQASLNIPVTGLVEDLHRLGYTSDHALRSGSVYQALQDSEPNRPLAAPDSLQHRYVVEDVPFGLVPLAELGELVNVTMPITQLLIQLASALGCEDYRQTGRTLDKMGLDKVPLPRLSQYLWEGYL